MIDVAADYGAVPTTREDGAALRTRVIDEVLAIRGGILTDVEFDGVLAMTPSFADEFFGMMPPDVRRLVKCRNMSPSVENLARVAIHNRKNPL